MQEKRQAELHDKRCDVDTWSILNVKKRKKKQETTTYELCGGIGFFFNEKETVKAARNWLLESVTSTFHVKWNTVQSDNVECIQ